MHRSIPQTPPGDLGHFSKTSPWEPSVHVPLLVTGPSLPQNVVVDHPVSLIDVPWDRRGIQELFQDVETCLNQMVLNGVFEVFHDIFIYIS